MVDKKVVEALKRRQGNKCSICGSEDAPLQVHHIMSVSKGGGDAIDNCSLVCPNCHAKIHNQMNNSVRGFDFESYLFQLLRLNPDFKNVTLQSGSGDIGVDIIAEEKKDNQWRQVFIECKAVSSFTYDRLSTIKSQLMLTEQRLGKGTLVLAFLGDANSLMLQTIMNLNIVVWDIKYIANRFRQEITQVYHPLLQTILSTTKAPIPSSPEMQLIQELKSIKYGTKDWSSYQKFNWQNI